jgi:hypothetical protein
MGVDMFKTQKKMSGRTTKIRQCIHKKGPSKANENHAKKRQSYEEKNKFCDIKVENTSHQQILHKYSIKT